MIELDEFQKGLIEKASNITITNYYEDKNKKFVSVDGLWNAIEELVDIIEHEREEREKEIQDMYEKEEWSGYEYGE